MELNPIKWFKPDTPEAAPAKAPAPAAAADIERFSNSMSNAAPTTLVDRYEAKRSERAEKEKSDASHEANVELPRQLINQELSRVDVRFSPTSSAALPVQADVPSQRVGQNVSATTPA